ncbi:hypothetical protein [Dactylosporangium sp. NPDC000521]|uniref:hypothetical protein n=1 Tax=Dactylosporangium sp. NPDC000521 TaxID=3363975 RepID=UPI00367982C8
MSPPGDAAEPGAEAAGPATESGGTGLAQPAIAVAVIKSPSIAPMTCLLLTMPF